MARNAPGRAATCSAASADGLAALGSALGAALEAEFASGAPLLIGLDGELGTGKTTLAAATLKALGVRSAVTSPTYGLVHPYAIARAAGKGAEVLHVDLYRLRGVHELDELGLEDGFQSGSEAACRVLLVEWFENAQGRMGAADIALVLSHASHGRQVELRANSAPGARILGAVCKAAHPELSFHVT